MKIEINVPTKLEIGDYVTVRNVSNLSDPFQDKIARVTRLSHFRIEVPLENCTSTSVDFTLKKSDVVFYNVNKKSELLGEAFYDVEFKETIDYKEGESGKEFTIRESWLRKMDPGFGAKQWTLPSFNESKEDVEKIII